MTSVQFDPYDWELQSDPYPTYKQLRDHAPVFRHERLGFWALSRHSDVSEALRDTATYSSKDGPALEALAGFAATELASILAMDPPRHDQLRGLVWRDFTKRAVRGLEAELREMATRYLDAARAQASWDFIGDFAGRIPMDIVSQMMDVPSADRDGLRELADTVVHRESGQAEVPPESVAAGMKMLQYFYQHVARHKAQPTDCLTDRLVAAKVEGQSVADMDLVALHFLFAIAGNETTTKILGNAVHWIARNPEARAAVTADPSLIAGWVEETLRFDASSQLVARTLMRDVTLHGVTMKEGDRVALLLGAANRDEREFDEPDRYDITRKKGQTLAFGHGAHYCLGASLARLEARVCLEVLLERCPDFAIDDSAAVRAHSPNVRGFASLPMGPDGATKLAGAPNTAGARA